MIRQAVRQAHGHEQRRMAHHFVFRYSACDELSRVDFGFEPRYWQSKSPRLDQVRVCFDVTMEPQLMNEKEKTPPTKLLYYKKGDLIVKQGDYGISIYKIIKGKVCIFDESGEKETDLGTLGPGGVIGEMSFLDRALEARFASARALEDSEVEAWHPATLASEYEQMPHIIRYIANQTLKRLIHMNNVIAQLSGKKKEDNKATEAEPTPARRHFYRKEVILNCIYRPVDSSPKVRLEGRIKDISLSGMGLEVRVKNAQRFSHKSGVKLSIDTILPNGKQIDFTAEIISVFEDRTPGKLFLGLTFDELTDEARKRLGFFLMPT